MRGPKHSDRNGILKNLAKLTEEVQETVLDQGVVVRHAVHNRSQTTDTALQDHHAMLEYEFHHVFLQLCQETFTWMLHERHSQLQYPSNVV